MSRHQSLQNGLFESAGKKSSLETNAVGNTISGSPSNLHTLNREHSNARFKKLDPSIVIKGIHNPSPERHDIFNVKEAIGYDKKNLKPVPYPFTNGNLSNDKPIQQSYQVPSLKSKIFKKKISETENCDQAYNTLSLPSIEKVNFS